MRSTLRATAAILGAGLLATTTSLAQADPNGAPTYRQLAGVGSDTTEGVMQGMSEVVKIGGTKVLASYDAKGPNITTKDPATLPACSNLARPNGSTAGRTALLNSLNANGGAGDGCYDFARSSNLNLNAANPDLTYVPFGVDGLTFAITGTSNLPRSLAKQDIVDIYKCVYPDFKPLLVQAGSGTRQSWLQYLGITEAQLSTFPCIKDVKNGQPVQEHDGRPLDDDSIMPFAIAQYIAQGAGTMQDVRGRALLGVIDGTYPLSLNLGFANKRDMYNIVPTSKIGTAPWSTVFVGPTSLVCQATTTIQAYGLGLHANCGDTSLVTP